MTRVVQMREPGGPEVLQVVNVDLPAPAPGEVRLRQTAIGVNYHDVYVRSGLYQSLPLPGVPGIEAIGVVEQVGDAVTNAAVGDRIGYITGQYGCYAQARNLDAALAVKIPTALSDAQAAASLMKAFTVAVLLHRVHVVRSGDTILVHAAAGGVGQLLCSWASHLGATVIGTVGSEEKARIARDHGADHVILYRQEDVSARVHKITGGTGVSAVYDAVGADTFEGSVAALDFRGHLIAYGQASGPVPPFGMGLLASHSLTFSRPIVFHYLRSREMLAELAGQVLNAFENKVIQPIDPVVLPLEEAAQAHRMLEARQSPGGIVLVP
ncbi:MULTISPECIES: quinone oxidoreductase [unclassified Novosphingobium]|uniref:quinone oxidoreductase family protein n=1 Tax=unclassified Novosphingobium TaxID=2644732 RepID=UPI00135731B2|nr:MULTISPECIES: quinone oxidoreductase [unclassified Novosphingobium]